MPETALQGNEEAGTAFEKKTFSKEDYYQVHQYDACPEETFVDCGIKSIDTSSPLKSVSSGETVSTGDSSRTEQLLAFEDIEAGVKMASVCWAGHTVPTRHWNTIEVKQGGEEMHANIGFNFLKSNHSFSPNMRIYLDYEKEIMTWYSVKKIAKGESLSWDYTTTEWDMDEKFVDWESGKDCQGFQHLPREDQEKMVAAGFAAPHVYEKYQKLRLAASIKKE